MNMRSVLTVSAATSLLLATVLAATADEFHYNNILIGDRAAGMGGAYTAVSDDPSGMYYNPAGLAYIAGRNISASVNAFTSSSRTYKGVMGGKDWTRRSSALLPNFFGIVQPVGRLKVGFSYAVPDSNQEDQDQAFTYPFSWTAGTQDSTHVINFNNKNDTTLFGPSAAVMLADNFSIGATVYVHNRSTEAILSNSLQSADGASHLWLNAYKESDEWGVRPIVGIMWAPADKVSIGLSVAKTFVLTADELSQSTSVTNDAAVGDDFFRANPSMGRTSDKRRYPYQAVIGIAFFPDSSLLLSADMSLNSGFTYDYLGRTIEKKAVVNGAFGAEFYLTPTWAIRGGLFTDLANTPKVVAGGTDQQEHIDQYGGSLSLSHFTKNTSLTIGGNYKQGDGETQIAGGTNPIQDASSSSWSLFISSSYSY